MALRGVDVALGECGGIRVGLTQFVKAGNISEDENLLVAEVGQEVGLIAAPV